MTNAQFMHGGIGTYITKWVGWQPPGQGWVCQYAFKSMVVSLLELRELVEEEF